MNEKRLFHIGTFNKPIGLKGEIGIKSFIDFKSFKSLDYYLNEKGLDIWKFQYLKIRKNRLIALLEKFNTRNLSEELIGKKIFTIIDRLDLKEKLSSQFFDLINFKIIDENNKLLGKVIKIDNFGAGNLINVSKLNNQNFYIPMNNENVEKIDKKRKTIFVKPIKGILE